MGIYLKTFSFVIATCTLLWLPLLQADSQRQENTLFKSWGLQFSDQGKAQYRYRSKSPIEKNQPWKPDLSQYQVNTLKTGTVINPVILKSTMD